MPGASEVGAAAQPLDVFGVFPEAAPAAPPAPPIAPSPPALPPEPPAPLGDALGVQHCSLPGPGQRPGVETYPGMVAQIDVSMHVPATPFDRARGHARAGVVVLDALVVDEPPTVSASSAVMSPLN